jgi:tetratricopeptide (TPR) repeat protein
VTDLALDTLEARGLIRLASAQPELEYLFRHALLQDTAYESLLKQERKALHQVVGQALEELYPDRVGEMAAVLARHFEQAGETEKAIDYLTAAAKFSIDRNAITEAYELYGLEQAVLIADACKTIDRLDEFVLADDAKRQEMVPGLGFEYSENSLGFSVRIAGLTFEKPEWVELEHGSLAPYVGCKEYGCFHEVESAEAEVKA